MTWIMDMKNIPVRQKDHRVNGVTIWAIEKFKRRSVAINLLHHNLLDKF